ncbi:MAG: hypothetical protein WC755_09270 [Candidatus Woesearchaeota archaeon]|jgi:hypothetical protein
MSSKKDTKKQALKSLKTIVIENDDKSISFNGIERNIFDHQNPDPQDCLLRYAFNANEVAKKDFQLYYILSFSLTTKGIVFETIRVHVSISEGEVVRASSGTYHFRNEELFVLPEDWIR